MLPDRAESSHLASESIAWLLLAQDQAGQNAAEVAELQQRLAQAEAASAAQPQVNPIAAHRQSHVWLDSG